MVLTVSGQLHPEENHPPPPWLGLGFGSRLGLILGLGGNQTIAPEEKYPRLGLGFGLRLVLELGAIFLRGNCSRTGFDSFLMWRLLKYEYLLSLFKRTSR